MDASTIRERRTRYFSGLAERSYHGCGKGWIRVKRKAARTCKFYARETGGKYEFLNNAGKTKVSAKSERADDPLNLKEFK